MWTAIQHTTLHIIVQVVLLYDIFFVLILILLSLQFTSTRRVSTSVMHKCAHLWFDEWKKKKPNEKKNSHWHWIVENLQWNLNIERNGGIYYHRCLHSPSMYIHLPTYTTVTIDTQRYSYSIMTNAFTIKQSDTYVLKNDCGSCVRLCMRVFVWNAIHSQRQCKARRHTFINEIAEKWQNVGLLENVLQTQRMNHIESYIFFFFLVPSKANTSNHWRIGGTLIGYWMPSFEWILIHYFVLF